MTVKAIAALAEILAEERASARRLLEEVEILRTRANATQKGHPPIAPEQLALQLARMVKRRDKVAAVKVFRDVTGFNAKDSNAAIDAGMIELRKMEE